MEQIKPEILEYDGLTFYDVIKKFKPEATEKEAEWILWNETCYPFDDEAAVKQLIEYFNKN